MVAYIDGHRDTHGVESICQQVPIAPATYWRHKAQQADPTTRSARAQRDEVLKAEILRVWDENEQVYGAKKVWRQLRRDGIAAARCTVERLMKALALRGVVRGGGFVVTTRPDATAVVPDLVDRHFTATRPNQLWVSDFTYVSTADGFVYTALVIDVFARRIVGWKVSHAMRTNFVLDALEQALHHRAATTPSPAWSITAIAGCSTFPCGTPSASRTRGSRPRSAAVAIRTTTRSRNP